MTLDKQQQMYDALRRIAKDFDTSERIMKNAERDYGLSPIEALEMAYDNMQSNAIAVIRGLRRPTSRDQSPAESVSPLKVEEGKK